jgi:hypothetical protein
MAATCVPTTHLNALPACSSLRHYFALKADPPRSAWRGLKLTVQIKDTSDLWRVCLKSKWARIEIPELEFEISADGKRHTDSIYNHIASAVDTLSTFVSRVLPRPPGGI